VSAIGRTPDHAAAVPTAAIGAPAPAGTATAAPLLEVRDLVKHYRLPRERLLQPAPVVEALRSASASRCMPGAAWASSANRVRESRRWRGS
jgi:hypothetical protein